MLKLINIIIWFLSCATAAELFCWDTHQLIFCFDRFDRLYGRKINWLFNRAFQRPCLWWLLHSVCINNTRTLLISVRWLLLPLLAQLILPFFFLDVYYIFFFFCCFDVLSFRWRAYFIKGSDIGTKVTTYNFIFPYLTLFVIVVVQH